MCVCVCVCVCVGVCVCVCVCVCVVCFMCACPCVCVCVCVCVNLITPANYFILLPSDTSGRHLHVFTCVTIEGKDYPIQASTRDEMLVWIKVIGEAIVRPACSLAIHIL